MIGTGLAGLSDLKFTFSSLPLLLRLLSLYSANYQLVQEFMLRRHYFKICFLPEQSLKEVGGAFVCLIGKKIDFSKS